MKYKFTLLLLMLSSIAFSQTYTIKGVLKTIEGQPMKNVQVKTLFSKRYIDSKIFEQKCIISVKTDTNGYFQIKLDTSGIKLYNNGQFASLFFELTSQYEDYCYQDEEYNLYLNRSSYDTLHIEFKHLRRKVYKPVIYLYPQKEQKVNVKVDFKGKLTTTYPLYKNSWNVIAHHNGDLINIEDNKPYSYLFWEGDLDYKHNNLQYSKGFIVSGDSTLIFLQTILPKIGLTPKEYNDFIVFWLPYMQQHKYNFIHFSVGDEYNKISTNIVKPQPQVELRVFMEFKPIDHAIKIAPQTFEPFTRKGFTLIEWGGTELKQPILINDQSY